MFTVVGIADLVVSAFMVMLTFADVLDKSTGFAMGGAGVVTSLCFFGMQGILDTLKAIKSNQEQIQMLVYQLNRKLSGN